MPVAGGLVLRDLVAGEHLIRVEELGHAGWGAVVAFNPPTQDVVIPPRAVLGLDGATAASHARRMGARFALVLEPKGGPHAPIGVRLIDTTGQERDAVVLPPANEAGTIDAAVMRLDEAARRLVQAEAQAGTPAAARGHGRRRCARAARPDRPAGPEGEAGRGSGRVGARSLAAADRHRRRPDVLDCSRRRRFRESLTISFVYRHLTMA